MRAESYRAPIMDAITRHVAHTTFAVAEGRQFVATEVGLFSTYRRRLLLLAVLSGGLGLSFLAGLLS